jgi:hypothetical protein
VYEQSVRAVVALRGHRAYLGIMMGLIGIIHSLAGFVALGLVPPYFSVGRAAQFTKGLGMRTQRPCLSSTGWLSVSIESSAASDRSMPSRPSIWRSCC